MMMVPTVVFEMDMTVAAGGLTFACWFWETVNAHDTH